MTPLPWRTKNRGKLNPNNAAFADHRHKLYPLPEDANVLRAQVLEERSLALRAYDPMLVVDPTGEKTLQRLPG